MRHKQLWGKRLPILISLTLLVLIALGTGSTVLAQGGSTSTETKTITYTVQAGDTLARLALKYGTTVQALVDLNGIQNPDLIRVNQVLTIPVPESTTTETKTTTYTVQAGDTLARLALKYGTTVQALIDLNGIQNRDLIEVDQVLTIPVVEGLTPTTTPPSVQPSGGPLTFTWALVDWQPADPNYVATLQITPQGGQPPYTFYHDGLLQAGATFQITWRRCQPKPGSVGVQDAAGTRVQEDYWLEAPYCPLGVEILEPEEGQQLKTYPRHFNITWKDTVNPGPPAYGIEIQVWEQDEWRPWKEYVHERGETPLFFVPDEFPGDLAGRVRMWGIYDGHASPTKTPWRNFEFRVTY